MAKNQDFYNKVFTIVKHVPVGKVTTYGAIAEAAGLRSSARTVGWALNSAKNTYDLPFHRVVNRNGELTGKHHFTTHTFMQEMLLSEGVQFNGGAVDVKKYFWKPSIEI